MRKVIFPLAAAALAVAAGTAAIAQPAGGPQAERGPQTRDAAEARAKVAFARMDVNQDGKIDAADREAKRAQAFDKLDTDGNGALSRAEFDARGDKARKGRGDRQALRGDGRGDGRGEGMRGHRGGKHGMARMADTDGDGTITQAEFNAAALARFDRADTDRDGTVTDAERKAVRDTMRSQRQARQQS